MTRFSSMRTGILITAGVVFSLLVGTRVAMAQAAAQPAAPDPFKLTATGPVLFLNYIKADKAADFEDGWAQIRGLLAKSDNADYKTLGDHLGKMSKVDLPPIDANGGKAVIYIFQFDQPSATLSYNPRTILFDYLKAGAEGSTLKYDDAMAIFKKLSDDYVQIATWPLVKISK
jgi:hypothetical protein